MSSSSEIEERVREKTNLAESHFVQRFVLWL